MCNANDNKSKSNLYHANHTFQTFRFNKMILLIIINKLFIFIKTLSYKNKRKKKQMRKKKNEKKTKYLRTEMPKNRLVVSYFALNVFLFHKYIYKIIIII